ncbi:hypothetical protein DGWBC_1522 [Dehalogenimonas sp. WBC-2]|nr:hypothetical protein DGWBC_1522 [Dehalogenimonas sp. WBC-2]
MLCIYDNEKWTEKIKSNSVFLQLSQKLVVKVLRLLLFFNPGDTY